MYKPIQLDEKIFLIDGFDCKMKERTGTYVLMEDKLTIVETSASPSIPFIIEGLKKLDLSPKDIQYIIVTHIHLDHAGGAGLFLAHCPDAKVIVHPRGARHLAEPSRLIAGARAVYGEKFDEFFDPIVPIPKNRLLTKDHKAILEIGDNCMLTFYHTPGHSNHHFSIHHSGSNGMFTGDTAGVRYPELAYDGIEFYLPSTSPNQFNPDQTLASIELYESLNVDSLYFGHYGKSAHPTLVYKYIRDWLPIYVQEATQSYSQHDNFDDRVKATIERITNRVSNYLDRLGVTRDHEVYQILSLDIEVCSMGLIDYLQKK